MSARGISGAHALPANPSFIDFPRSDGDPSQWPTNTAKVVDGEGHVNFMRPVPLDESLSIKWRREVGNSLAQRMGLPTGPSYLLRGWPDNYQMFDHNKGPQNNPRHDAYLMGSASVKRFRSVPEFIPHALWLIQDATLNRGNCSCKYCGKKPQREITATMGLLPSRSTPVRTPPRAAPASAPGPVRTEKPVRERPPKPYAAIRRAPKAVKLPQGPKQQMVRERNNDLRAAYGDAPHKKRWFREGELLWCALNPPIPGRYGEVDGITFWPGLVEEVKLNTKAIPRPNGAAVSGEASSSNSLGGASSSQDGVAGVNNGTGNGDDVPWSVQQTISYKMKLLAISHSYFVPDDQVLPYQAYGPSSDLLQAIHDIAPGELNPDPARISAFNPCPPDAVEGKAIVRFADAAAPYALAVQIASYIGWYWSPTDDWEYRFSISPPTASAPAVQPLSNGEMPSLHAVMNASMTYNSTLGGGASGSSTVPAPSASIGPVQVAHTVAQTRYQGLWWGAERIWTDELIRLKLSRQQIAPMGVENIYAPAGPSKTAIEYNQGQDGVAADAPELGAAGRGVFMKMDGLFVVELPKEGGQGTRKECQVSGMLYELVDEDWEEPNGDVLPASDKGKGKEPESASVGGSATPAADIMPPSGSGSLTPPSAQFSSLNVSNMDPASSVEPTLGTEADAQLHTQPKHQSANDQLSHPILSSPFSLPDPPEGFKFRPILTPGHEVVVSLSLIAGRYYPRLLQHPLMDHQVQQALNAGTEDRGMSLWALEGLTPGYHNAVDPTKWKPTRLIMIREADKEARTGLKDHWQARASEKAAEQAIEQARPQGDTDVAMGSVEQPMVVD
ncbi:hypothetical protein BJ138DRAFT_1170046 [Hygrophoropsis aurantiaca]|uniref:Uncharacterized protein n=1 Tax=Hygrophoropsis aurantiaca TaxID=72124 RepID=A0ACB8APY2_9AGAM|nr:hypothetical protein BJ138DRAFT_1170046 [Hygrophoropsis aurantiaca]